MNEAILLSCDKKSIKGEDSFFALKDLEKCNSYFDLFMNGHFKCCNSKTKP